MDHNRDNNRGRNYGRDSERDYDGDRRHNPYSNNSNSNRSDNYHSNSNHFAGRGDRGFGNGNGNGSGSAGYGRGGGGGFGGRGYGGRGNGGAMNGGGRGNNRHMGEHPAIQALLRNYESQLNDAACLPIIDPVDTDRDTRVGGAGNDTRALPVLAAWRYADPVGLQLDKLKESNGERNIVRSNYFRVPTRDIPAVIYHYNVSIFKYKLINGEVGLDPEDPEDISQGPDKLAVSGVMNNFLHKHATCWHDVGTAHNGASSLFTTQLLALPLPDSDAAKLPLVPEGTETTLEYPVEHMYASDVFLSINGAFSPRPFFSVVLRYTGAVHTPLPQWSNNTADFVPADSSESRQALHAMDVALLSFARKQLISGRWILNGNKVFSPADSKQYVLNDRFVGMLGYHASFRACLSGLALVKDISVTCFLKGGNLAQFVTVALGCRRTEDLFIEMHRGNTRMASLEDLLKNCKLRVVHLNMIKKFRSFDHAANSRESAFETDPEAVPTTVADYFYTKYNIRLKYPAIPTVNVGSRNRAILMPMEQLEIVQGQTRQRSITGDVSAQIIKHAAMLPNDRFKELTQTSFLFPALENDFDAQAFGIANITARSGAQAGTAALPMKVKGTILPPAKLQYANNRKIEPQLKGSWNLADGVQFSHQPPKSVPSKVARGNMYPYAGLLVHRGLGRTSPQEALQTLQGLLGRLEGESRVLGIPLELVQQAVVVHQCDLLRVLSDCQERGARIAVVVMLDEALYPEVKLVADRLSLSTQCARYIKVVKSIRNYETNLLIKMNMKLGGTNHTLAARRALRKDEDAAYIYQKPPHSISWLFNEPTMVMGIDVNHPNPGEHKSSVVAVVASMDGMLGQYCTYITECSAGYEPVSSLHQSFEALLRTFSARNEGSLPRHIIVYRDGVADSQFMDTLTTELMHLREAVDSFGRDEDYVKISFVVCQKRHQTRFFFQPAPGEEYMNPCVGLCVDSRGFGPDAANPATAPRYDHATGPDALGCIMGVNRNEFYLNSHAAVLGTSKPTKYILLHDEIGFKMSELQLLTFWLTHLYGRCTRSVSIVAPAYYAHWAARRGKALLQAGLAPAELKVLSEKWLADAETPAMYFI